MEKATLENKIDTLIELARKYFEDNKLTVNLNVFEGKRYVEIGSKYGFCEWDCEKFEDGVDEAIKDISEWFAEDNEKEWKEENEIAKAVENL